MDQALNLATASSTVLVMVNTVSNLVTTKSWRTLLETAAMSVSPPALRVRVEGHTDDTGNTYANMKLAERRALAVREELVRLGLPRKLFTLVVLGSAEPIATNSTEEGRALNRRVEIELVGTE